MSERGQKSQKSGEWEEGKVGRVDRERDGGEGENDRGVCGGNSGVW